jgi:hypothetical protein
VIVDEAATQAANEITFYSCSLRGDASQGFSETADYALQFNSNQNAQSWKFIGGDISYHNTAIYNVGEANTSGDIEVTFEGVYFDSILPAPTIRDDTKVITRGCHHANGGIYAATLSENTAADEELYRADRSWKSPSSSGRNLIPNGDFFNVLVDWDGAGLPIGNGNSATITANYGGLTGTYLNINQALTTANSVRFRPNALPYSGRATATIIMRNADVGNKNIKIGFGGLFPPVVVKDTEWQVFRITTGRVLTAEVHDLQIYTEDATAFNVDVAYVGITMGEGGDLLVPPSRFRTIEYTQIHDWQNIADGARALTDFTIPGAEMGDFVLVSSSSPLLAMQLTAVVQAEDTVRLVMSNLSGAPVDLGIATFYVRIWKRLWP